MMVKILVNDGIHPDGQTLLEEAGYQVDTEKVAQEDLPNVLPDYDVVIVRSATKIRQELIEQCPKLKIIARGGVGLDNIDVEFAKSKGITVMNTPAASSQSVAELVYTHLFSLARSVHLANREMPTKVINSFTSINMISQSVIPNAFRMATSRLRCSITKEDKPNNPKQAIKIATIAK